MDWLYFSCYIVVLTLLGNRWGVATIVAFIISAAFAEYQLSFIITSLCYMPLCLHPQKKVSLTALSIVITFGLFAWEGYFMPTYFLSDAAYITLVTVLNLALIVSLLKSQKNGITATHIYELYDTEPNSTCSNESKRGQRP